MHAYIICHGVARRNNPGRQPAAAASQVGGGRKGGRHINSRMELIGVKETEQGGAEVEKCTSEGRI